jgi:hypothetical protein
MAQNVLRHLCGLLRAWIGALVREIVRGEGCTTTSIGSYFTNQYSASARVSLRFFSGSYTVLSH